MSIQRSRKTPFGNAFRPRWFNLNLQRILLHAMLIIAAMVTMLPLVWMLLSSLKTKAEIFVYPIEWLPRVPRYRNYPDALASAPFGMYFLNSGFIGIVVTLSTLCFSSLAGYGFAKFEFPGRDIAFIFILSTMMIPFQVIMIPLYLLTQRLGWLDSYPGLIVPGALTAFGVFLMRQFSLTIPDEYLDAARIDGCSEFRIWWMIAVPLCKPALSALAILTFLGSWNNLLWPLIITTKDHLRTLPLGLALFQTEYVTDYGLLMAGSVLASLPIVVLFLVFQKEFVQGIVMSGIKG